MVLMADQTIVLYPSPAIGHLIAMVELGKLILKHHPSSPKISILITTATFNVGSTTSYINRVSQTNPSIQFHHLPILSLPPDSTNSSNHHEFLIFQLLRLNNPSVRNALQTISQTSTIKSFITDFFCAISVLQVTENLNIPTFFFYTSGLGALASLLYFPTIHENAINTIKDFKSFKDFDTHLHIPGVPPILASDLPKPMLDITDKVYHEFLYCSANFHRAQGIIANSFESLEPQAAKAIRDGLCVPDAPTPPLYCIGPLIADRAEGKEVHECLSWLDSQPSRSVVFLCFGSLGLFSKAQLVEIAIGLEKSGQRFLWVVRSPPTEDKTNHFLAPPEPDLSVLLPEGFLDRTKDRGLVLKLWAPQVEVLNHESVGGFVTHCGWNSVLEAVCGNVPMIAWPLYAEQRLNKVFLVEGLKLALPMEEVKDGFVSACEVEKRVKQLMESDEGKVVREQTSKMSEGAKVAMSEGGSSLKALSELVALWKE
ncbi:Udp-glycosyltransferase 88b1 [Thalictrum thalictroides]|uniref:Glycosyltransferase n=1 Tax=Thalictrum thalictroides TaxID=46969 RepID=A0A7J6UZQ3_THATH|nr:Udp-glycosyltransferase 88b1 [Thalictrum thalictroides]